MVAQDDTAPMVERDEAAAQLIDKAEGGDPDAQYLVGKLYQDGPVLIPDSVEARYWFGLSAQQGRAAAQYELGKLLLSDDPEVHDPALGIEWLKYATNNGSDHAAYRLGKEYLKGEIVAKDTAKALDYLSTTVRNVHLMLHCAFERAVKERLILRNPTDDCIAPKIQKFERKTLPPEDMKI